jgi:CRISPR-associated protein (TIGR03984 family)
MSKQSCQHLDVDSIIDSQSLISWLKQKANEFHLKYLLAHAEDGVIWGYFQDDKLNIAHSIFPEVLEFPELRLLTLQQCRVFGEPGEILLWQTDKGLKARLIQDDDNTEKLPDEVQIILGTQGTEKDGFTLLSDGQQGLKHAVPLTGIQFDHKEKTQHRPVRLLVRHYIDYNDAGVARIFLSRLVSLTSKS